MQSRGFTLIEIIIYVAIITIVTTTFVNFSTSASEARSKSYAVTEVQSNARIAMNTIVERIRASISVNTSTSVFGVDPGSISLQMASSSLNPTIISLDADDGIMQMTEGVASPLSITSDEVKITKLEFTLLGNSTKRQNIRIEMEVEYNSNDVTFKYTQALRSSISIRK
jgi:prepilin-type N-terminal cleavage/methylation domain-containing protein